MIPITIHDNQENQHYDTDNYSSQQLLHDSLNEEWRKEMTNFRAQVAIAISVQLDASSQYYDT